VRRSKTPARVMLVADMIIAGILRLEVSGSIRIDSIDIVMAYTKIGHDLNISSKYEELNY